MLWSDDDARKWPKMLPPIWKRFLLLPEPMGPTIVNELSIGLSILSAGQGKSHSLNLPGTAATSYRSFRRTAQYSKHGYAGVWSEGNGGKTVGKTNPTFCCTFPRGYAVFDEIG